MKIFEWQTVIDSTTGLPATPERLNEIRNMLIAEGIKVVVDPAVKDQLEAEGVTIEQAEAEIWASLGGRSS